MSFGIIIIARRAFGILKSGNHNLAEYIRTAQEEGLFVILRPGPYVCAEWEFGGYPSWLQNNKDLVIRNNKPFLDSCNVYIKKLADEVKELQITHGGPIIMVQVENGIRILYVATHRYS